MKTFMTIKELTKDESYGAHSVLLIESICEVETKHCPQTF